MSTFQTLQTWIDHNSMCYHNFKALPNALPNIFSQFSIVWSYLQLVTTRYRQIYKKIYIIFKKNDGDALQITQNETNLRKIYGNTCGNRWDNTFKLWQHVALWPIHVCRLWKVTVSCSNLNFSQISQAFPLFTLEYIK